MYIFHCFTIRLSLNNDCHGEIFITSSLTTGGGFAGRFLFYMTFEREKNPEIKKMRSHVGRS